MKVIGFTEPGGPEVLRAFDIAEPAVGPDQVRVRVLAAAVNPTDAVTRSHRPLHPTYADVEPPLGWDAAGIVGITTEPCEPSRESTLLAGRS